MNYAEAAAYIKFTTTDVILEDGKATICGYFENSGDKGGYVESLIVRTLRTSDDYGNFVWATSNVEFNTENGRPLKVYVRPGATRSIEFYIWNSDIPDYGHVNYDIYTSTVY